MYSRDVTYCRSYVIPQAIRPINEIGRVETKRDLISEVEMNDLEIAIMICIAINTITTDRLRNFINALKASATDKGREKYCYERNYLEKKKGVHNNFKSIIVATEKILDEFDKSLHSMLSSAIIDEKVNFEYLCADCISVLEENLSPILGASSRFFVSELAKLKDIPEDIWCYSDLLNVGFISEINWEVYNFLFVSGSMNYVSKVDYYRFLNGNAIQCQIAKIMNNIDLKASNGKDDAYYYNNILLKKEYAELKKDVCRIIFSVENVKQMFRARGNEIDFLCQKSMIDAFENNTYSLNYYNLHYKAAYPLDKIKTRKSK